MVGSAPQSPEDSVRRRPIIPSDVHAVERRLLAARTWGGSVRFHIDLQKYDLVHQNEPDSPNVLFIGLRTVVYADRSQKGDKTHRLVLETLQDAVDALSDRYRVKVFDQAEEKPVEVERVRLKAEGGRLGGKDGIDKAAFELLKSLTTPLLNEGAFIARVANRLEAMLEATKPIEEKKGGKVAGSIGK